MIFDKTTASTVKKKKGKISYITYAELKGYTFKRFQVCNNHTPHFNMRMLTPLIN